MSRVPNMSTDKYRKGKKRRQISQSADMYE